MALRNPSIEELTDELSRNAGWLESPFEAAAHLESLGINDQISQEHYGQPDVFSLALVIAQRQRGVDTAQETAWEEERRRQKEELDKWEPPGLWSAIPRFFFRGVAFGLPMAIMIFSILLLLYSLWAYYYFSTARATAIGVGTALSYLLAGGFTQAIGRRGLMYLRQGMFLLCLKVAFFFVAAGVLVTALVGIILYFFFSAFPVVSGIEKDLAVVYYFTLSLLWLSLSTLYMLQKELLFSIAIGVGIGVVYIFREWFGWEIVPAHQVGIISAAAFALIATIVILAFQHNRSKDPRLPISTKLPRFTLLIASVAPYFLFGLLYFVLIFGDRIIAWTGRTDFRQTFIWFQTDYEVGVNWALLGLLPALGALEYAIYRFSGFVKPQQLQYTVKEAKDFRSWFFAFYRRSLVLYFVMSIIGAVGAYFFVRWLVQYIPEIAILLNDVSVFVFIFGSIGYSLAAFSLLNVSLFFWLSRPRLAILAIIPALIVDFLVGFILSRLVVYYWAVIGFALGGIVFAVVSLVLALRVLTNLDYYYYSSV